MNTPATCPQCGSTLPADAPEGLCPACLMRGGLDTDATIKMTPSQKPSAAHVPAAQAPEELAPLFPQLEIIELLGRGGMGTVYKARQPKLNRFVALKIISGDAAADPHFAERFQREAQALAKLNHPNIVSVFDFGETGGLFYFLMEFVDGANLRTLIRSGEMKPEAALALIPAFCDALQYAHDEGVVHRDIKPENVLVDKKGRVKIADFGLAKLTGSDAHDHTLTRTGMYLGTPRYMAPEQVEKPETVDHRADIYSLGVVFYEMLTGELPMGRFAPPSKKVDVDVRFDEIVLHALERDVALRYQHASEIKTDVQSVTGAAAVHTPPTAEAPPRGLAADSTVQPRLSRMALIGAIWALFGVIVVIPSMMLTQTVNLAEGRPSGLVYEQPPVAFTVFMAVLLFIGMGAPIGTTILGAISMSNIKKSGGKLYGLPLAFADAVFFPMLLLHSAMAVLLGLLIVTLMKFTGVNAGLGAAELGLLAMLPLFADFFIVRALWRRVIVTASPVSTGSEMPLPRPGGKPSSKNGRGLMIASFGILIASFLCLWFFLTDDFQRSTPDAGTLITANVSQTDGPVTYFGGHTSAVKAVSISPDGHTLVSAGMDGRVIIRDLPDGGVRRIAVNSSHPASTPIEQPRCAAILADNEHVLVGGSHGSSPMKIHLFKNEIERLAVPNEHGASFTQLLPCDYGAKLAYITRGTELNLYDMGTKRLISQPKIFPGKVFSNVHPAAVSPDGAFIAVPSSNMEPHTGGGAISTAPCKLTVFDTQGVERLSWQFADFPDFAYAQVVFTSTRTLVVCLPSGKMQRWKLDDAWKWQPVAETVRSKPGSYSTSAVSRDGKIIWLAEGHQITGIDSATGKAVAFIELKIRERMGNSSSFPIEQIAVTPEPFTLAVALWDGRVALAVCRPLEN